MKSESCSDSIDPFHRVTTDAVVLERIDSRPDSFSFRRFKPMNILDVPSRETTDSSAVVILHNRICHLAVKVYPARRTSTYHTDGIHRSHWFSPLAYEASDLHRFFGRCNNRHRGDRIAQRAGIHPIF